MTESLYISCEEFTQVKNHIVYILMHNGFLVLNRWEEDDHIPIETLQFYTQSKTVQYHMSLSYRMPRMVGWSITNVKTGESLVNMSVPFNDYETVIKTELSKISPI